jgi:hypothetical protein
VWRVRERPWFTANHRPIGHATGTATLNINTAGLVIVGLLILTWSVTLSISHFGHIEQKWTT